MDTVVSANRHQHSRVEARWRVSVSAPHAEIKGETESISPSSVLVSSREALPLDSEFLIVINPPDHEALNITGKVVGTRVCCPEEGSVQLGADVEFVSIAEDDRKFLQDLIARLYHEKLRDDADQENTTTEVASARGGKTDRLKSMFDAKMPVSYSNSGKMIKALGTRFSEKGCYMITKIPPRAGGVFRLQITNAQTSKSTQVECAVVQRRHFIIDGHWGIILQFMNMTEADKMAVQQVLEQSSVSLDAKMGSLYRKSKMLRPFLKYFSRWARPDK